MLPSVQPKATSETSILFSRDPKTPSFYITPLIYGLLTVGMGAVGAAALWRFQRPLCNRVIHWWSGLSRTQKGLYGAGIGIGTLVGVSGVAFMGKGLEVLIRAPRVKKPEEHRMKKISECSTAENQAFYESFAKYFVANVCLSRVDDLLNELLGISDNRKRSSEVIAEEAREVADVIEGIRNPEVIEEIKKILVKCTAEITEIRAMSDEDARQRREEEVFSYYDKMQKLCFYAFLSAYQGQEEVQSQAFKQSLEDKFKEQGLRGEALDQALKDVHSILEEEINSILSNPMIFVAIEDVSNCVMGIISNRLRATGEIVKFFVGTEASQDHLSQDEASSPVDLAARLQAQFFCNRIGVWVASTIWNIWKPRISETGFTRENLLDALNMIDKSYVFSVETSILPTLTKIKESDDDSDDESLPLNAYVKALETVLEKLAAPKASSSSSASSSGVTSVPSLAPGVVKASVERLIREAKTLRDLLDTTTIPNTLRVGDDNRSEKRRPISADDYHYYMGNSAAEKDDDKKGFLTWCEEGLTAALQTLSKKK